MNITPKAVVLLSGGMDSATALAIAKDAGFCCCALTIEYGQRHAVEIEAARGIARLRRRSARDPADRSAHLRRLRLDQRIAGAQRSPPEQISVEFPSPMCRPATRFFCRLPWPGRRCWGRKIFFLVSTLSTIPAIPTAGRSSSPPSRTWPIWRPRPAVEGREAAHSTPLIQLTKAQIIRRGLELGVDYRHDDLVLRSIARRPRLWPMRRLHVACEGLCENAMTDPQFV